jgi:adenylate cyclase
LAQQAKQAEHGKASYDESESCFYRAYEIAKSQKARSLELRAAISLFRLSEKSGNPDRARQVLGEVYQGFVEGLNTPDLIEAETLLNA